MFSFVLEPENLPFAVALAVMLGIALLEGISTLLGAALSGLIDAMLPDMPEAPNPGIDLNNVDIPDGEAPYALSRFLSWLRVGEVPVLMLIVIFLTAFGLVGLALQSFANDILGFLVPGYLMAIPATLLSLPMVRIFGGVLSRIMPADETEVVSADSLIGRIATITIGEASGGRPAEARVTDKYGTGHLLMVEPDLAEDSFSAGEEVLLIKREGAVYKVITPSSSMLTN
jgi:hypothetical protein